MQIKVTFKNTEHRDEVKQHAEDKVDKITKFIKSPVNINFIFSKDKLNHVAELNVSADGTHYTSSVSSTDFLSAIDEGVDKVVTQIKKHKDKLMSKRHEF